MRGVCKLERDLAEVVEDVLADPKLSQDEREFLESCPDLFKMSREDFETAAQIIEGSLPQGLGRAV